MDTINKDFEIIVFQQTPKVDPFVEPIPVWIKENKVMLMEFMVFSKKYDTAIGLAANQVSWKSKRINSRFFVHRLGKDPEDPFEMIIDPIIIEKCGIPQTELECCLTWPHQSIQVQRYLKIAVSYWTIDGEHVERKVLDRFDAQVFQHEMDHLDGVEEKFVNVNTQLRRIGEKVGRNDPCPCGAKDENGNPVKYKKCCGGNK